MEYTRETKTNISPEEQIKLAEELPAAVLRGVARVIEEFPEIVQQVMVLISNIDEFTNSLQKKENVFLDK